MSAAPAALAAPNLAVDLSHTPNSIPRNYEQVTYEIAVTNTAPANPVPGDDLTCRPIYPPPPTRWFNVEPPFQFQWLANGVNLDSSADIAHGAQTETYEVQADDSGKALQCVLRATNASHNSETASVTPPKVVGLTPPAIALPEPSSETAALRPTVAGTASENAEITCSAPATGSWTGSPNWTFEWLWNGSPAAHGTVVGSTATTSSYRVAAADIPGVLQCKASATNGGGTIVTISANRNTSPAPSPAAPTNNSSNVTNMPFIEVPNSSSGPLTVELMLPSGLETRAAQVVLPPASGWSCTSTDATGPDVARVICTRSTSLSPGASFPNIGIVAALGSDAPDAPTASASVIGGGSPPAFDIDSFAFESAVPFGITEFNTRVTDAAGNDQSEAGGHPFSATAAFALPKRLLRNGVFTSVESTRRVVTDLPAGFIGVPRAVSQLCQSMRRVLTSRWANPTCPAASVIGTVDVSTGATGFTPGVPLYAVVPERGVPAQFVFAVPSLAGPQPIALSPELRPGDGYAIRVEAPQVAKGLVLESVSVTLCGHGAELAEGPVNYQGTPQVVRCLGAGEPKAADKPFLRNPTSCSDSSPVTRLTIDSWEHPGILVGEDATSPLVTSCDKVPFSPTVVLRPTSDEADSPTGLDVSISVPSEGLETASRLAQSDLRKAVVTLPKGMSVNPAAADGLGACAPGQIKLGTNDPVECPDSSKVGSAEVVTPLLDEHLNGSVYLAKQGDNPFRSLLALYLVVESKERGILVKIPGRVDPRRDGQLVATFDDNPQLPFSSLKLHFNEGNRAPLLNPPRCGTYGIESALSPWSAPGQPRSSTSTFQITSGPGGGPCPNGNLEPKLNAGVTNPVAGSRSPFVLRLSRDDGTQRFSALDVAMPPGLTAYLKGLPYCPDAALAGVSGDEGTGAGQIASPSCPAASQIGTVSVGAGGGSNPFYVNTGRAYLAGPYKGAPLSIAIVTPAVAGPFDLGSVVVRSGAYVDPVSARITVKSDPIPTILHGIPLDVRDIRVNVDRRDFILAPTNCEAMSVAAQVRGENGGSATASNRFQVGECASLGFKPHLSLRLKGGTKRGKNPALTARVTYPKKGDYANVKRVSVALPHSEFLDQSHIRTVCTRVQFAADACPKGAIYGRAEATSPLLGYKLKGPVYLRSSSHKLPDLVVALRGPEWQPIEIDLAGRIDSVRGGIRNSFEMVPDAPVSSFVLKMQGGKKGLLVNSRNICKHRVRATVKMDGQNGKVHDFRPVLRSSSCKKKAPRKHRRARG